MKYETTTNIIPTMDWKNEILTLDVKTDGIIEHHFQEIVRFKDKAVREALIALGWTPPKDENHMKCSICIKRLVCPILNINNCPDKKQNKVEYRKIDK